MFLLEYVLRVKRPCYWLFYPKCEMTVFNTVSKIVKNKKLKQLQFQQITLQNGNWSRRWKIKCEVTTDLHIVEWQDMKKGPEANPKKPT
jgi:hypothetical protein